MLTLENKNFFGNQGQGYLLTAIASVLIGGTSIFGGRATIIGTVFGCLIIGMIEAGLVASGLTGAWVRTSRARLHGAIVFYLYVDEPEKRSAFSRASVGREFGRPVRRVDAPGAGKATTGRKMTRTKCFPPRRPRWSPAWLTRRRAGHAGRRSHHVYADGRQCRRRRHARPPDRRGAGSQALGVQLNEQFSAWAPETMINQFKEAVAASRLHRDHGPSRQRRLPRPRRAGVGQGIVVTSATRR
jgi:hypothetical protein